MDDVLDITKIVVGHYAIIKYNSNEFMLIQPYKIVDVDYENGRVSVSNNPNGSSPTVYKVSAIYQTFVSWSDADEIVKMYEKYLKLLDKNRATENAMKTTIVGTMKHFKGVIR